MKLSILMPVYNEKRWIERVVAKVLSQQIPGVSQRELIIVDDGSTDGTAQIVRRLAEQFPEEIVTVFHERNCGKGAAVRTAVDKMTGEVCLVQDADLEYDPSDYGLLLEPILSGRADCVFGSRFTGTQPKRVLFFWHYLGNKVLTLLSNVLTNINLTDVETCYKAFRSDLLKSIPLRCDRFGFEPEITAKVVQRRARIYEVGINYNGRTYAEGKKITWRDGLQALAVVVKYRLINDSRKKAG